MKTCLVVGCEREYSAKGYCRYHYEKFRKYGDPLASKPKRKESVCAIRTSRKENPICSIEGCEKPVQARGWCSMHYKRWEEHGDPLANFTRTRGECLVEGCSEPAHAKGYCLVHYSRWRRSGDPEKLVDMPKGSLEGTNYKSITVRRVDTLAHILFEKVVVEPEFRCWEWQGGFSGGGGGKSRPTLWIKKRNTSASRLSYATFVGPVPKGKLVCHICDRGDVCINPSHLYLGSYKENLNDAEVSRYLQEKGELTERNVRGIKLSFLEGISNEKIARCYGISTKLLEQVRKKLSWALEFHSERKRLSKGMVLSEKDVVKIKTSLRQGVSGSSLARQFGVSRQLIAQIKQGAAWKHIKI